MDKSADEGPEGVDDDIIRRAQDIIDSNNVDFVPMACTYLQTLRCNIDTVRRLKKAKTRESVTYIDRARLVNDTLIPPVLELKSNASMFNYPLIGMLADVLLDFLEKVPAPDTDVLDILDVYCMTLQDIIDKKLQGSMPLKMYGTRLEQELKEACRQYFSTRAQPDTEDQVPG